MLTKGGELESVGVSVRDHRLGRGTLVKLYDLAGQVDYYGLHQIFLTESALYVVVWDAFKYRNQTEALTGDLLNWLATLHLRAPRSRVILVGSHRDKFLPDSGLTAALALLRRSRSIESIMAEVEQSLMGKHDQWKQNRERGRGNTATDGELRVEKGILLVSSSPTARAAGGLPELQLRLQECGDGTPWWIPPSWDIALVVLSALRNGEHPLGAAMRHIKEEAIIAAIRPHIWIEMEELRLWWDQVQDALPAEHKPGDSAFALQSAMDLLERGGSLIRHSGVVFLDVEVFALSLAPILNHKTDERDEDGSRNFAGTKLDCRWQLEARTRLVNKGILHPCFARFLWHRSDVKLPEQTFEVLVKLGMLLPLPARTFSAPSHDTPTGWELKKRKCGREYMVLMRLPRTASSETRTRFSSLSKLQENWGVTAKWAFDIGHAPHGLVERFIASCHSIGDVVPETCWRGGACFVAHQASKDSSGGSFALTVEFVEDISDGLRTAGTLVVRSFGYRKGRGVWGALRFAISAAWRLFEDFPGLGWEGWVECPEHQDWKLYHLAGVRDIVERLPGYPIVSRNAQAHCPCSIPVARRLGSVLDKDSKLGAIFEPSDRRRQGYRSDGDTETRFVSELNRVLNVKEEKELAIDVGHTQAEERPSMPEWVKDAIISTAVGGPAAYLALVETWSPLLELANKWKEGSLVEAIALTLFLLVLVLWVAFTCAFCCRKLRRRYQF